MRGIPVVVYGLSGTLDGVRPLVADHAVDTLRMPVDAAGLDDALKRALREIA